MERFNISKKKRKNNEDKNFGIKNTSSGKNGT